MCYTSSFSISPKWLEKLCNRWTGTGCLHLIMILIIIGNKVLLDKLDKFCYVGDMLDVYRRYDSAAMTKVICAQN